MKLRSVVIGTLFLIAGGSIPMIVGPDVKKPNKLRITFAQQADTTIDVTARWNQRGSPGAPIVFRWRSGYDNEAWNTSGETDLTTVTFTAQKDTVVQPASFCVRTFRPEDSALTAEACANYIIPHYVVLPVLLPPDSVTVDSFPGADMTAIIPATFQITVGETIQLYALSHIVGEPADMRRVCVLTSPATPTADGFLYEGVSNSNENRVCAIAGTKTDWTCNGAAGVTEIVTAPSDCT